ncbi:MAG TPA: PAS domain S-box protein [Candidatus Paceibacterota bacterium]
MDEQFFNTIARTLVEHSPDGIFVHSEGKVIFANTAALTLLGATKPEDVIGKPALDFIHPDQREFVAARMRSMYERGEIVPIAQEKFMRVDGIPINVEVAAVPITINGKPAVQGMIRDISAHKELEERLMFLKAKDDALLIGIGEGVVAVDEFGNVILANPAAEAVIDVLGSEMLNKPFEVAFPLFDENGKQKVGDEHPLREVLATRASTVGREAYVKRQDGTMTPVDIVASPVLLGGSVIGAIAVFRDITRAKAIEKMRTDFLTLASHQLRTPLSGARWLIETLIAERHGPLSEKQLEYLERIRLVVMRMIRLASDMLAVLHFESGNVEINKEVIDVSQIFGEVTTIVAAVAASRKVTVHNAASEHPLPPIATDPRLLSSILQCFISNAVEYSNADSEVVFDVKEVGGDIEFSVQDHGIGIPLDEQSKISERFYRASNAKQARPDGTGLGLYLASLLAHELGGALSFESEEGKGSVFRFTMHRV